VTASHHFAPLQTTPHRCSADAAVKVVCDLPRCCRFAPLCTTLHHFVPRHTTSQRFEPPHATLRLNFLMHPSSGPGRSLSRRNMHFCLFAPSKDGSHRLSIKHVRVLHMTVAALRRIRIASHVVSQCSCAQQHAELLPTNCHR